MDNNRPSGMGGFQGAQPAFGRPSSGPLGEAQPTLPVFQGENVTGGYDPMASLPAKPPESTPSNAPLAYGMQQATPVQGSGSGVSRVK